MRTTLLGHSQQHDAHHQPRRRASRVLVGAALALGLGLSTAACGSDSPSKSSAIDSQTETRGESQGDGEHDQDDVTFAQDMLLHHAQAIEMVDMTEGRDLDPEVRALAAQIETAQGPEIDTFTRWLDAWGEDVPDASDDHAGHSMGGDMAGMMTAEDMSALESASDAEFQDMWLSMMIEHHEGAVEMAQTQVDAGEYQPAIDLAESIATSQSSEIETMRDLLS